MDGLVHMFLKVLNMSLSATIVISIVILLRFLLKKMPKRYSYILWFVVFIRLLVPISVESRFSIIPQNASETVYEKLVSIYDLIYQDIAAILPKTTNENINLKTNMNVQVKQNTQGSSSHNTDSDASQNSTYSNETLNPNDNRTVSTIDNKTTNINKTNFDNVNNQLFQQYLRVISYIWIGVAIVFLFSSFVRLTLLKRKLRTAIRLHEYSKPIYETDQIKSPFLMGFFKPIIYLPINLTEKEKLHVILHETMHIKRKDYILKPIAFLTVLVHWFNPIAWVSFYLFVKDMEMSCDEMVLNCMDDDIRIDYSKSLLSLSLKQNGLLIPLAFGESNTKARVKNVLGYVKKTRFISILAMLLISIAFITLLTTTTGETTTRKLSPDEQLLLESIKKDDLCKELLKNRTPYIGDNSKVLALVYTLPVPDGLKYKSIELQTKTEPYELHVYYEYDSKHKVDTIDNTMEFQNAALLFASIKNMGKYTIHRLYEGGESTLTYNREELEEEFVENFYSYSEEWRLLRYLMEMAQSYLNTPVKYHDVEKYTGEALTIGIIGETPTIREKQVKFVSLEFSDLEDGTVDTKYDAIFITRDNLSQAAEDKYAPIYKNSKIPMFFINSKKSYVPFTDENYSYEDGLIFGEYTYLEGILYNAEREGYQSWGFGLYNDIESQENIIAVYSNVFRTISELKNKDNNFNENDLKEINKGE